ncbi:MAG: HAD-IA family hydrolase [Candidatus Micrarchaeota archaeon]|nr:HAD-IA family hydrolase [Candidatus Micrarchaeota archaeon]
MLKAILFDLDNTLLDFSGFKRESALAAAKAMKQAGLFQDEKIIFNKINEIYEKKGVEYQLTFNETLRELGVENDSQFERAKQAAIIAYTKKKYALLKPRQKVIQTLNSLKSKYKLGIVTDAPKDKAWQRLILAGLDGYFFPVITFSDTNVRKPSTLPFKRALVFLKVQPKEVLYVGDFPERDIIGAKKMGMKTCLAKYGCTDYSEESNVADYTIEKFEDINGVVNSIE